MCAGTGNSRGNGATASLLLLLFFSFVNNNIILSIEWVVACRKKLFHYLYLFNWLIVILIYFFLSFLVLENKIPRNLFSICVRFKDWNWGALFVNTAGTASEIERMHQTLWRGLVSWVRDVAHMPNNQRCLTCSNVKLDLLSIAKNYSVSHSS